MNYINVQHLIRHYDVDDAWTYHTQRGPSHVCPRTCRYQKIPFMNVAWIFLQRRKARLGIKILLKNIADQANDTPGDLCMSSRGNNKFLDKMKL